MIHVSELFSRKSLLTWPNAITLVRLGCLPVFLWLLFGRDSRLAAGVMIGCLGATDWVDGWVARRFNQTSPFGALFDPTVDRVLFIVGLWSLGIDGAVAPLVAVLILVREIGIGLMMVVATAFGMERFPVTYLGKWATFILMFAVPALTLSTSGIALEPLFFLVGWVLVVPGLVLSYVTAAQYVPKVREHLRSGRSRRTTV
ncbi:MAG: CDP-diacylglycerol--glycerol-3-phosphate 3-phosphatidyltransferase [Actinomycetota bacterium]